MLFLLWSLTRMVLSVSLLFIVSSAVQCCWCCWHCWLLLNHDKNDSIYWLLVLLLLLCEECVWHWGTAAGSRYRSIHYSSYIYILASSVWGGPAALVCWRHDWWGRIRMIMQQQEAARTCCWGVQIVLGDGWWQEQEYHNARSERCKSPFIHISHSNSTRQY